MACTEPPSYQAHIYFFFETRDVDLQFSFLQMREGKYETVTPATGDARPTHCHSRIYPLSRSTHGGLEPIRNLLWVSGSSSMTATGLTTLNNLNFLPKCIILKARKARYSVLVTCLRLPRC